VCDLIWGDAKISHLLLNVYLFGEDEMNRLLAIYKNDIIEALKLL